MIRRMVITLCLAAAILSAAIGVLPISLFWDVVVTNHGWLGLEVKGGYLKVVYVEHRKIKFMISPRRRPLPIKNNTLDLTPPSLTSHELAAMRAFFKKIGPTFFVPPPTKGSFYQTWRAWSISGITVYCGQNWLYDLVLVPLWVPFILFSIYPAIAFIRSPYRRYRRRKKGLCLKCGYNLTGNVSGVCPECGEKI